MVQVLPPLPTFGETLGGILSQVGPQISKGISQYNQNKVLGGFANTIEKGSDLDITKNYLALNPEQQRAAAPLLSHHLAQAKSRGEDIAAGYQPGRQPENIAPADRQVQDAVQAQAVSQSAPNRSQAVSQPPARDFGPREFVSDTGESIGQLTKRAGADTVQGRSAKLERERLVDEQTKSDAEVAAFAKDYADEGSLRKQLDDAEQVVKLFRTGKISTDQNWLRNVSQAYLESGEHEVLANFLKTPEQQRLWPLLRSSLNSKEIGGSNPSTKEVLLSRSAQVSPYMSQLSGEWVAENALIGAKSNLEEAKFIRELRAKNKHLPAQTFKNEVQAHMTEWQAKAEAERDEKMGRRAADITIGTTKPRPNHKFMYLPATGRVFQVPKSAVKVAEENGAEVWNGAAS